MSHDRADDRETNDESFHPLGSDAEGNYRELLETGDYDADLGMEMARDAMQVTKGELTEAEFYDRYHEAVVEEFGEDDRPMADEMEAAHSEGRLEKPLSALGADTETRRETMKKMGAGAAAVGFGAWSMTDDEPEPALVQEEEGRDDDDGTQWGMTLDLEVCDGCLSCVVACNEEHNWNDGANWMYIIAYGDGIVESPELDDDDAGTRDFNYLIRPCQHCTDAPCEKVCPTTARHTREKGGLVLTDYDVCIGCRYCQVACPYGVNYFQWGEPDTDTDELDEDMMYDERDRWVSSRAPRGVMEKCIFDPARQDGQSGEEMVGTTACEDACPPGAIQFGDMNDDRSDSGMYKDNPSRGRALYSLYNDVPDADEVTDELAGVDDDLESIVDAVDVLDENLIARMLAIEMTSETMGEGPNAGTSNLAETEREILDFLDVLANHGIDLEDQSLHDELGISDPQEFLETEEGNPASKFDLLEEYNTDPNVRYLGNEPGPNAEQVPGPVAYEDVGMVDNRKDVLDEGTVDGGLY